MVDGPSHPSAPQDGQSAPLAGQNGTAAQGAGRRAPSPGAAGPTVSPTVSEGALGIEDTPQDWLWLADAFCPPPAPVGAEFARLGMSRMLVYGGAHHVRTLLAEDARLREKYERRGEFLSFVRDREAKAQVAREDAEREVRRLAAENVRLRDALGTFIDGVDYYLYEADVTDAVGNSTRRLQRWEGRLIHARQQAVREYEASV